RFSRDWSSDVCSSDLLRLGSADDANGTITIEDSRNGRIASAEQADWSMLPADADTRFRANLECHPVERQVARLHPLDTAVGKLDDHQCSVETIRNIVERNRSIERPKCAFARHRDVAGLTVHRFFI